MSRPLVRAQGLALGYRRREVLAAVDLEIQSGQLWFFIGPNGSGKTTLLRGLLRELEPLRGELWLDSERMDFSRIGFVPQRSNLNRALPTTLRELVSLGMVGLELSRAEKAQRLHDALAAVGLDGMGLRAFWELSGGQRQRALLARALIRHPEVLLLDEPTAGLDLAAEHALLHLLKRFNRDAGITIAVVAHDLSLAARYATHVALFRGGGLVSGPRDEVLTEDRLLRVYRMPVRVDGDVVRVDPGEPVS